MDSSRTTVRDVEARVVEVVLHPLPYFTLVLEVPAEYAAVGAGQFVMLETTGTLEPYLRRAFSVADVSNAGPDAPGEPGDRAVRIELLGKVVGRGTRAMSELAPGERRALLGPLGRGFALPSAGPLALVAGGVGSAPLLLLGRQLLARGLRFDFFYGGRSARDLARVDEFEALAGESGGRLVAATEDGSRGFTGRVTAALEREIDAGAGYRELFACGPMPMLAALAALSARSGVGGQAALETEMGCGFGACLGCAVPHASGRFALCCKDGPVFRLDEVRW
jgi:dihydroorotate dehydrogenase electron transfer subunit